MSVTRSLGSLFVYRCGLGGSVHCASFGGQGKSRIGWGEKVLYIVQNRVLGGDVERGLYSWWCFLAVTTPALSALRSNNRYKNRDAFRHI